MKRTISFFAVAVLVGCIDISQNVSPTSVTLTVGAVPEGTTATTTPTDSAGARIVLDPDSLAIRIGVGVVVKVSAFDLVSGEELSSQQRGTISYTFDHPDPTLPVATVSKVDGRWLTILGINAGTVNLKITTAGGTGILPIQVSP